MPKIRQFTARTSPGGPISVQRLSGADLGGDGGLIATGKTISATAGFLQEQQLKSDKTATDKQLAAERLKLTIGSEEAEANAELGAEGHVQNTVDGLAESRVTGLEDVPESQRDYYNAERDKMRQGFVSRAVNFQGVSAGKKRVKDLGDTSDTLTETVTRDPNQYEDAKAQLLKAMESLKPSERELVEQSMVDRLGNAMWDAQFSKVTTAQQAHNALASLTNEDETWSEKMSPEKYAKAVSDARKEVDRQENLELGIAQDDMSVQLDAYSTLGGEEPAITREQYQATAKNDRQKEELGRQYDRDMAIGTEINEIEGMSRSEITARIDKLDDEVDAATGNEAITKAAQRTAAINAAGKLDRQLKDDAAGYVTRQNDDIQAAYTNFVDAVQTGDEFGMETARNAYIEKSKHEQLRLGVHPADVVFLPKNYVDNFKKSVGDVVASAEKPQEVADFLATERAKWGEDWATVSNQLSREEALTGPQAVAARLAGSQTAVNILLANEKTNQEWNKSLGLKTVDVDNTISSVMSETVASMGGEVLTSKLFKANQAAVTSLAQYYSSTEGISLDEAAERAHQELIGDYVVLKSTYYIPREQIIIPMDDFMIEDGAALAKGSELADIVVPSNAADEGAFRSSVKANGVWRVSKGGEGLTLTAGGRVIERDMPDGSEPYSFLWDELKDLSETKLTPQKKIRLEQQRKENE